MICSNKSNFSNFSALHHRSKLLSRLFEERGLRRGDAEWNTIMDSGACPPPSIFTNIYTYFQCSEFELMWNALYTAPSDQSVWIYHNWLVREGMCYSLRPVCGGVALIGCPQSMKTFCGARLVRSSNCSRRHRTVNVSFLPSIWVI
jgi:hypothetical protein